VIAKVRRFRTAVAALIVVVAGSFVRFLVETHGKDKFRRLHALTPFRPGTLSFGLRHESRRARKPMARGHRPLTNFPGAS
jgi:hypothetical protein